MILVKFMVGTFVVYCGVLICKLLNSSERKKTCDMEQHKFVGCDSLCFTIFSLPLQIYKKSRKFKIWAYFCEIFVKSCCGVWNWFGSKPDSCKRFFCKPKLITTDKLGKCSRSISEIFLTFSLSPLSDSNAQNIINQALFLGNPSVFNTTRDDCKWKYGNERDTCPDPDINVILYTSSNNGKNRGKLRVSVRPCSSWCMKKMQRELELLDTNYKLFRSYFHFAREVP